MEKDLDESRTEGELDEVLGSGIATDMISVRLALFQFFKVKHQSCVVKAREHALRHEGTKAVRWAWVAKVQRSNKTTIRSLTKLGDECMLHESKQTCTKF